MSEQTLPLQEEGEWAPPPPSTHAVVPLDHAVQALAHEDAAQEALQGRAVGGHQGCPTTTPAHPQGSPNAAPALTGQVQRLVRQQGRDGRRPRPLGQDPRCAPSRTQPCTIKAGNEHTHMHIVALSAPLQHKCLVVAK